MPTLTPFLMFENRLEDAVRFYTTTFPDSRVEVFSKGGPDGDDGHGQARRVGPRART